MSIDEEDGPFSLQTLFRSPSSPTDPSAFTYDSLTFTILSQKNAICLIASKIFNSVIVLAKQITLDIIDVKNKDNMCCIYKVMIVLERDVRIKRL